MHNTVFLCFRLKSETNAKTKRFAMQMMLIKSGTVRAGNNAIDNGMPLDSFKKLRSEIYQAGQLITNAVSRN